MDLDTFLDHSALAIDRLVPSDIYGPALHSQQGDDFSISISKFGHAVVDHHKSQLEEVAKTHFLEHPVAQKFPKALGGAYKVSDFITQQQLYRLEGLYQQYLTSVRDKKYPSSPNPFSHKGRRGVRLNFLVPSPVLGEG